MNALKIIPFTIIILFFEFLQFSGISFFDVRPDFVLLIILAIPFLTRNILEEVALILLALLILKFTPVFSRELVILLVFGLLNLLIQKKITAWSPAATYISGVVIFTALSYVFLAPKLFFSSIFFLELIYNFVFGIIIFWGLLRLKLLSDQS